MYKDKKVTALIRAAGNGSRMGYYKSKLLLELDGKTIIRRTVEKICSCKYIDDIIIVIRDEDREDFISSLDGINRPFKFVKGGATREESTFLGLKEVSDDTDIVLTHDGARPFVSVETLERAIENIDGNDGTVVCIPSVDTIKVVNKDMSIINTPDRDYLYNVQTPQVFKKNILIKSYKWAMERNLKSTDDSNIVERHGGRLKIVIGEDTNIKITTRKDLIIGEFILKGEK